MTSKSNDGNETMKTMKLIKVFKFLLKYSALSILTIKYIIVLMAVGIPIFMMQIDMNTHKVAMGADIKNSKRNNNLLMSHPFLLVDKIIQDSFHVKK